MKSAVLSYTMKKYIFLLINMKTRTRTHKSLDKIVEDIQKTEIQENSDNLLHHQNFFSRKKYTSDFKKYLWKEIYAEKNLYMMFYCTMITL